MPLDRHVDPATAVTTSLRAAFANPGAMARWGIIVVGGLFPGALPLLIGVASVVPALGHATCHLYRRLVVWVFRLTGNVFRYPKSSQLAHL